MISGHAEDVREIQETCRFLDFVNLKYLEVFIHVM